MRGEEGCDSGRAGEDGPVGPLASEADETDTNVAEACRNGGDAAAHAVASSGGDVQGICPTSDLLGTGGIGNIGVDPGVLGIAVEIHRSVLGYLLLPVQGELGDGWNFQESEIGVVDRGCGDGAGGLGGSVAAGRENSGVVDDVGAGEDVGGRDEDAGSQVFAFGGMEAE